MNVFDLEATIRINTGEFEHGINQAQKKFNDFSKSIENISKNIKTAYSNVGDLFTPLLDGFKAVESVGTKAASGISTALKGFAAASTAVAGFGAAAVKTGAEFDTTMSKVLALSGATETEFKNLRDAAISEGERTKFSANEVAEAYTYMAMAGWDAGDMLSGISGLLNLAAASGEDLATTSDIVTDALTAFNMTAADSDRFANVIAATATSANTDVYKMGQTFKYVAPIAGSLSYKIEDVATAIGLMASAGVKDTMAGTALRSILTRLSTNAGETKTQMGALSVLTKQLGVEFYNTDGSARDLNSVLMESRAAWAGLSDEQQISYAKVIAGQEAMSGWIAIMNASEKDVNKLTSAIEECNGAAEEMARIMNDNLQGDITMLGSAFGTLQIVISDALNGTLREFVQFGTNSVKALTEGFQGGGVSGFMSALSGIVTDGVTMLAGKAPEFVDVSLQFMKALADGFLNAGNLLVDTGYDVAWQIIGGVGSWISQNADRLVDVGKNMVFSIFNGFLGATDIISENIGKFIPLIVDGFTAYHEALFTAGVEILGAIGRGLVESKDEVQRYIKIAIEDMVWALRENAPMIIEGGLALLEALVGAITENLPLIVETGAEIIGRLVSGIATASPAVQAIIGTAVLPYILKIAETAGSVGKLAGDAMKFIGDHIGDVGTVVKTVAEFASSAISTIINIGSKLMGGIQALFSLIMAHPVVAVVAAIIAAVVLLWNNCEEFRDAVKAIWDAIVGFFQAAAELIKAAFDGVVDFFAGVWQGIQNIFTGVAEFFGNLFQTAAEAVKSAWSAIVDFFSGVWEGIQNVFSVVADVLGSFFQAAVEAVQSVWGVIVDFFSGVWEEIQSVFSTVAEVLGGLFQAAAEAVQAAWEAVTEFFSGVADGIRSAFEMVSSFISEAFTSAWNAVKSAWDTAVSFFTGVWDSIREKGGEAADRIGEAFGAAWERIKAAWDGALSFFSGIWEEVKGVFGNAMSVFSDIGGNIVEGIRSGISNAWKSLTSWVSGLFGDLVNSVKSTLGIKSPSKVFASIGGNMALGVGQGWSTEYSGIKTMIQNGLDFGTATVGLSANVASSGGSSYGQGNPVPGIGGMGNTTINIYNPEKRDAVEEAREWRRTMQRISMGYV